MPTGNARDYVLFNPTKRLSNKALALRIAADHFEGQSIDSSTLETPEWGRCHVAAYTDTLGAMIATTNSRGTYGDEEWHSKGRIIMVREQPRKMRSPARVTIYVLDIEPLFNLITIGRSGIRWSDISKNKLYSQTLIASELAAQYSNDN